MAAIAKSGTPSLSTAVPPPTHSLSGLYTGENIASGDACYIKTSDGKVYRADGTATGATTIVAGYAMESVPSGGVITLYYDIRMYYGAGLIPGTLVYLGTTGGLSDAPTTGGTIPLGIVVDATRIQLKQSF